MGDRGADLTSGSKRGFLALSRQLAVGVLIVVFIIGLTKPVIVMAQDEETVSGEVAGGKTDVYPVDIQEGQMVEGEFTSVRNQVVRLSVSDAFGNSIYLLGQTNTAFSFYYVFDEPGRYFLAVTNPDGFAVGTRGYRLDYRIVRTDLPPGSGSGKVVEKNVTESDIPWSTIWWIVGVIVVLGLVVRVFGGSRKRPRRYIERRYRDGDGNIYSERLYLDDDD